MAREKFTAGRIDGYTCPKDKQQVYYWDAGAPGLGIRVTAGSKVYIFQGRLASSDGKGKEIRITIGDVPKKGTVGGLDIETFDEENPGAREIARKWALLVGQGIDPRIKEQEIIAANEAKRKDSARQDVTFGEAWNTYLEARRQKWGERHLLNHLNMAKPGGERRTRGRRKGESDTTQPGPLHSLLAVRLAELDGDAVKAWLEPLAARTPTQAAQTYRALRAFLAWCADRPEYRGIVHAEACNRRMARDTLPKARAKDDCLQREQLRAWFEHMRRIGNPVISAYLQALLLTGARREELAGLRWEDVDFQWKSITIRDKVEGERTIPLTPYVASLLAPLPRRTVIRDGEQVSLPWVFSSPTAASGRLQEPRIQHVKALDAAGLPHVSLHGLRRSFGTLAEWVECPAGISAQIMGHKPSAIAEKHYRRRPLDLLRQWHTKIEDWILEQAGVEVPREGAEPGLRVVPSNAAA